MVDDVADPELRARRAHAGKLALLLIALMLVGPSLAAPARAQSVFDPALRIETFVTGLARPVALDWLAPDDLLVVEREDAEVRRVLNGVLLPAPVYQHPLATEFLLGIAINDEQPPRVFLFVEDQTGIGGNRVMRFSWNSGTGQLENGQTILQVAPAGIPMNEDDGGKLLLGPPDDPQNPPAVGDGRLLYVVSGYLQKGGQLSNDPGGDPPDNAGAILRVLQDGSPAPGNPFTPYCSVTTATSCSEDGDCPGSESCRTQVGLLWSYGLRNSFGIALDPVTGSLWDEENGDDSFDELNRVAPGMNSGWTPIMGPHPPGPPIPLFEMPGGGSVYRDPEYSWLNPTGPTGIAFPFGSSFGMAYNDKLLFADFNAPSRLYAMPLDRTRTAFDLSDRLAEDQTELNQFAIASGFSGLAVATEFGPDGALYVITIFDGVIHRITGPGQIRVPALSTSASALLLMALAASAWLWLRRRPRRAASSRMDRVKRSSRGVLLLALGALLLGRPAAAVDEGVWIGLEAPVEGASVSGRFVEVLGRAGAFPGGFLDVVVALDVSESTLLPAGLDVDGDGRVSRSGCFGPPLPRESTWPPGFGAAPRCREVGDTVRAAELVAAKRLIDTLDAERTRVGLVTFHGQAVLLAPVGSSRAFLHRALAKLEREPLAPSFGTDLRAAIDAALGALSAAPEQRAGGALVLLSDGQPTLPGFGPIPARKALDAARRARRAGVRIHSFALGADPGEDLALYARVAAVTGGRLTILESPGEILAELPRAKLGDVARIDMRNLTTGAGGRAVRSFPDGSFDGFLELAPGANTIRVSATGPAGGATSVDRLVHFLPGAQAGGDLERLAQALRERTAETERLHEVERARQQRRLLQLYLPGHPQEPGEGPTRSEGL